MSTVTQFGFTVRTRADAGQRLCQALAKQFGKVGLEELIQHFTRFGAAADTLRSRSCLAHAGDKLVGT